MKDDREHLQLFDLIAREWQAPAAVEQICFNASRSAVAFACAGGAVAIAACADKSPPASRLRRASDTAQLSIRPREGTYAGLRYADHTEGRSSDLAAHGADNFVFGKSSGRMNTTTPGGLSVHLPPKAAGDVIAVSSEPGGTCAFAVGATVHLWHPDRAEMRLELPFQATSLSFSPQGHALAIGHGKGLVLWSTTELPQEVVLNAAPTALHWSADGHWIACCLGADGLGVVNTQTMTCTRHGNFPAPVTMAGFGYGQSSVVASGAYRTAAWRLADDAPILTGKAGLVLVDAIATSPNRNLVAVGYANGLLSLTEIGNGAEILLRQDTGAAISALVWSDCGRFLALGGRDGSAALVEFPDEMFKS